MRFSSLRLQPYATDRRYLRRHAFLTILRIRCYLNEMKPYPRQILSKILKTSVESAIENEDQMYGRQLATVMERHSKDLRLKFGRTPKWEAKLSWCLNCRISRRVSDKKDFCHICKSKLWFNPTIEEAEEAKKYCDEHPLPKV